MGSIIIITCFFWSLSHLFNQDFLSVCCSTKKKILNVSKLSDIWLYQLLAQLHIFFFFKKRKLIFVLCVHVYIETRAPWHIFLYCFLLSFMLKSVHFYFLCMDVLTPCMAAPCVHMYTMCVPDA